jgi:L-fucose isomerase-like protein
MWCELTEKMSEKPCCAAEAMRGIRRVDVGGISVGLAMLDAIFAEVASLGLTTEEVQKKELLRLVKIYNYVPPQAEDAYAEALLKEFMKNT